MVPQGQEPSARSLIALTYATYANAFGWTPNEVDAQPAWLIEQLIPICNVIRKVGDGD